MIINIINSPKGGGAEFVVSELHKFLLSKFYNTHIIFFCKKKYFNPIKNSTFLGLGHRNFINIIKLRKLIKNFQKKNNEEIIIHSHLTIPFYFTILATLGLPRINLVHTEHSIKFRNFKFLKYLDIFFYKRYSKVICISKGVNKSLKNWLGKKYMNRLVTIYNGSKLYTAIKRKSLKSRLPRLISVGSLRDYKNFKTTIMAVSSIKDLIFSYVILGEGPEYENLKRTINRENLQDKVKLKRWSDHIEKYFYKSDILIIPSKFEGFGLVAVEGMSTGLPVVASNVIGLREILSKNHKSITLVSNINSANSWAMAIKKTINKISIYGQDQISNLSQKQAKNYTFEIMFKKYLDLYYNLL